jgi:glycerate kinase
LSKQQLTAAGVRRAYALTDIESDVQRCINDPGPLLEQLGRQIAEDAAVAAST